MTELSNEYAAEITGGDAIEDACSALAAFQVGAGVTALALGVTNPVGGATILAADAACFAYSAA